MSTIRLIYILLHVLEIWMLFVAGRKMSQTKTDKEYWKASLWAFVPYVFVLGLRFGHNIDWNYYSQQYLEHKTMNWNTTEPLFHFIFYFFYSLGIPYYIVISLQVALFMYSFLLLAKYFRKCLYYVLPLLPVVAQSNDNYIRWYWAVSFILIAFYWFLSDYKKKHWKFITFFIAGVLVHNGSVLLILLIPAYYFLKKMYLPPKISVLAIFISVFFMSIAVMGFVSEIAATVYLYSGDLLQDSRISSYLLAINDITSGGLNEASGIKEYGLHTKIITFIAFLPVIIYGPHYMKDFKYGILFYNLFVIGAFLNPFFSTVEIFDRYSKTLLIFQAITAGVVYYMLLKDMIINKGLKLFCLVSMLCCFYPFISYSMFMRYEYRMMYIWNAGGRDYIDTNIYIDDMLKNR